MKKEVESETDAENMKTTQDEEEKDAEDKNVADDARCPSRVLDLNPLDDLNEKCQELKSLQDEKRSGAEKFR